MFITTGRLSKLCERGDMMAIPKYFEMYKSFLRTLIDRNEHPYVDVKKQVISDFQLTSKDIAELLPSGK